MGPARFRAALVALWAAVQLTSGTQHSASARPVAAATAATAAAAAHYERGRALLGAGNSTAELAARPEALVAFAAVCSAPCHLVSESLEQSLVTELLRGRLQQALEADPRHPAARELELPGTAHRSSCTPALVLPSVGWHRLVVLVHARGGAGRGGSRRGRLLGQQPERDRCAHGHTAGTSWHAGWPGRYVAVR